MFAKAKAVIRTKSFWFFMVLAVNICFLSYFCMKKTLLFVDDGLSYAVSNGSDKHMPRIKEDDICVYNPAVFHNQFTVQSDEIFQYGQITKNLEDHPPLYYFIFHAINSFFIDTFSKWTGLIFNLICFLLTQMALYALSRKFVSVQKSFLTIIFYGFSVAAVSTVVYIRSYMLLTFLTTIQCLFALKLSEESQKKIDKNFMKNVMWFCIILFCGLLTHFYFLITSFILCAGVCVVLLFRRMFKKMFVFMAGCLIAVGLCPLLFHSWYIQLFEGHRTSQVSVSIYENIFHHQFDFSVFDAFINTDFLGHLFSDISLTLPLTIMAGIYLIWCLVRYHKINPYMVLLAVTLVFSVSIISLIMPLDIKFSGVGKRYFFNLAPLFTLLFILLIDKVTVHFKYDVYVLLILVCSLIIKTYIQPDFSVYLFQKTPENKYATYLKNKTLWIKYDASISNWKMVEPALYSFWANKFIIFKDFNSDCYQNMLKDNPQLDNIALIVENKEKSMRACKRIPEYNFIWGSWSCCMYIPKTSRDEWHSKL